MTEALLAATAVMCFGAWCAIWKLAGSLDRQGHALKAAIVIIEQMNANNRLMRDNVDEMKKHLDTTEVP